MENELSKTGEEGRLLVFSISDHRYAIPLLAVREVIGMPRLRPMQGQPRFFAGIFDLRGKVISVLDLRIKLGFTPGESSPETAVIILDLANHSLGVVVDRVDMVRTVSSEDVLDASEAKGRGEDKSVQGVLRGDEGLILVLDIASLLDVEDVKAMENSHDLKAA